MPDQMEALCARGLASPDLFERIEALRDRSDQECFIVSFQLPFALDIDFEEYSGRGNLGNVEVDLILLPASTLFDGRLRRKVFLATESGASNAGVITHIPYTQCLARVNLWGRRRKYYKKYVEFSIRDLRNDVVIPSDDLPYTWNRRGAAGVDAYEDEVSYLALSQAEAATRRLLRDYMAISFHEIQIPQDVYSAFASPRAGRYYPLGKSPDLLVGLLPRSSARSLRTARKDDVIAAARWPVRGFSPFEGQVLALKRLSDGGEPELALVGLMALVEWLLKDSLSITMNSASKRKINAAEVFRRGQDHFCLPEGGWSTLHAARILRNNHVHERPTSRFHSYDPATISFNNPEASRLFNDAVFASLELFRRINLSRRSGGDSLSTPDKVLSERAVEPKL